MEGIPAPARTCAKFVEITIPLILVGQLCIYGMIITFDKDHIYVRTKQEKLIVKGRRGPVRNLYLILIQTYKRIKF